jgi:hypothetical protein
MMKVSAGGKGLQVREANHMETFRGEEKGAVGLGGIAIGRMLQVAKKPACSVNITAGQSAVHKHQKQAFPKADAKSKLPKEEGENITRAIDKENSRPESDWRSADSSIINKSTPSVQKNSVVRRGLTDQKQPVSCPTSAIKNIIIKPPIEWDDDAFTLDFETKYHVLDASYIPPFPEPLAPTLRPPQPVLAAAGRATTTTTKTKTKPTTDGERS